MLMLRMRMSMMSAVLPILGLEFDFLDLDYLVLYSLYRLLITEPKPEAMTETET